MTGSVQGIGYATARALAAQGCNIMLSGLGDAAEIEQIRAAMEAEHDVRVRYHGADLSRRDEVEDIAAATLREFGSIDVLVNNAAVRNASPMEAFTMEGWDLALAVNLTAPFHLMRLALPAMRRNDWGRIINISSGFGLVGSANRIDYVTTKTALIGMTRAAAVELKDTGVTCNAVCPGATFTPRQEARVVQRMAREHIDRDEAIRRVLAALPADRFVESESIAATIVFLCSAAGDDITGVALPVDGGFTAGPIMIRDGLAESS